MARNRVAEPPPAMGSDGQSSPAIPLDDTTRTAPAALATEEQTPSAYLLILAGSNVGEMYRLEQDRVVVGRGDKVDLRLIDDGISREHVRLINDGGQYWLEDLGSTNGTYCNGERVERRPLTEGDKILLGSTTILRFTYQDQLEEAFQRQMSESALRDGLTHAYNKRYFGERLESEMQFALRHRTPLALMFLDIDHFKRINDAHGHQAGDYVLTQLSTLVSSMLGEEQVFARYGGEEFAIIARGTDGRAARALSERVRASVESHPFAYAGTRIPVTVSIGIAEAPAPGIGGTGDLLSRADEAMYDAKRAGRNRVGGGDAPPTPVSGDDATPVSGGVALPTPSSGGDAPPKSSSGGDAPPTPSSGGAAPPKPSK